MSSKKHLYQPQQRHHNRKTNTTSMLERYTDDLTAAAKKNPQNYKVIARDQEKLQVEYNLARKTKNNPILIGDAGVGKTAIVE